MHLRRSLALATGALVLAVPALSSCGFDYATDRIYTPAAGVNDRDATVDVLNAVVVSAEEGSGVFIASFSNNSNEDEGIVESIEGDATAESFEPVEIPVGGFVNLAEEGGPEVTGDFAAGDFVSVTIHFGDGERVQMDVPVVPNCDDYEGLDGVSDPEQCEVELEDVEH